MPQKKRRSPAEKKALSYARDRRNDYGENDKAARKAIPRAKAQAARAVRRKDKQVLARDAEEAPQSRAKPTWKKVPDASLGARVEAKSGAQDVPEWNAGLDPSTFQARLLKARLRRLRTKHKATT